MPPGHDPIPSARALNPKIPPAVDELIRRTMAKDAATAYANVRGTVLPGAGTTDRIGLMAVPNFLDFPLAGSTRTPLLNG